MKQIKNSFSIKRVGQLLLMDLKLNRLQLLSLIAGSFALFLVPLLLRTLFSEDYLYYTSVVYFMSEVFPSPFFPKSPMMCPGSTDMLSPLNRSDLRGYLNCKSLIAIIRCVFQWLFFYFCSIFLFFISVLLS